ncbi:MAG: class I SAM-dependent methyltransferase [Deltaproteobacteria bacterium]|nr:class I SAM-dependent methyltransferase [Deltaproteobacteria bacterium]
MKDQWDQRYSSQNFFYGREINDFLRDSIALIPKGGRVLMLAEGEGRNAVALARLGFQVTAVDWSKVGLQKLNDWARSEHLQVETVCADLTQFDFGQSKWDAIVSIWFHLPTNKRKIVYPKVEDALAPRGVFLLESYTPRQLTFKTGGPPDVDMLVTADELRACWHRLRVKSCHELERDINEGQGHKGRSAVVQLVAVAEP